MGDLITTQRVDFKPYHALLDDSRDFWENAGMAPVPPHPESRPEIARRIKMTREAMGLSQDAFGRRCGTTQQTINNYETKLRRPSLDAALGMVRGIGCSLDWIYRGDRGILPGWLLDYLAKHESVEKSPQPVKKPRAKRRSRADRVPSRPS